MFHCFISSREYMIIFLGLYFSKVIGTKVLPKEPIPPVIRIIELVSIIIPPYLPSVRRYNTTNPLYASVSFPQLVIPACFIVNYHTSIEAGVFLRGYDKNKKCIKYGNNDGNNKVALSTDK